ncbi:MAG: TIR domain-containing protein [Pyrinomonadaceae bacterium]
MNFAFFIGSSSEQLPVAKALEANLTAEGHQPTLWSREAHGSSEYNLEALLAAATSSDFAIFVFAPDDQVSIRGTTYGAVRDNILFELGLFAGELGRKCCFVVQRIDHPMRLPSDLEGLTTLTFSTKRADENLRRALGPTTTTIVDQADRIAVSKESHLSDNDLSPAGGMQRAQHALKSGIQGLWGEPANLE